MLVTDVQVQHVCRQFKLSLEASQRERVARAFDILKQHKVTLVHSNQDYTYWNVQSQHDKGTYQVVQSNRFNHFACMCPDARKNRVGTEAFQTLQCKHAIACQMEWERMQLSQQYHAYQHAAD